MAEVSVIIPLHNQAALIGRALASVRAQTFRDLDLVVVDDGSSDGGADRVTALGDERVRVLRSARAGPGAARNLGAGTSDARWLAFLDADDEWDAGFLETVVSAARASGALAVFSGLRVPGGRGSALTLAEGWVEDYFQHVLDRLAAMTSSSVLIERTGFLSAGGFAPTFYAEDIDLWLRLACAGRLWLVPKPLVTIHRDADPSASSKAQSDARLIGLERALATFERLNSEGLIPADQRESYRLFAQNLEMLRAVQLLKARRAQEAIRALLLHARPTRYNLGLYAEAARALSARLRWAPPK